MVGKSDSLGLAAGTLALSPYDSAWADIFSDEADRIRTALGGIACTLDHIGSTSVSGLSAKPILDLALCVVSSDEAKVATKLTGLGYADRGFRSGRLFVRSNAEGARTHNLHLYRLGDLEQRNQIAFRDALRADAKLCADYATLKQNLVARLGDAGRAAYAEAKAAFIKSAIAGNGPGNGTKFGS